MMCIIVSCPVMGEDTTEIVDNNWINPIENTNVTSEINTSQNIAQNLVIEKLIDDQHHNSVIGNTITLQEKAVELAKQTVGAPYLYGGKGYDLSISRFKGRYLEPEEIINNNYHYYNQKLGKSVPGRGIDCSGLIFWAYNKAAGITHSPSVDHDGYNDSIPVNYQGAENIWNYDLIEKVQTSTPPSESDLKIGDLLHILVNDKPPGVTDSHVGMYIGNGEVIHSTGPIKGVEILPLDDWLNLPIGYTKYKYKDYFTGYGSIRDQNSYQGSPKLHTNAATDITSTSAILHGQLADGESGSEYQVCFRYEGGTTGKTKVGHSTVSATSPDYEFELTGLEPGTTYYYRAVHVDSQGVEDTEKHLIDADNFESFITPHDYQTTSAWIPKDLLDKIEDSIEENPNYYYYDESWEITKDQYKLMIATLAWSEGGRAGYQAHSTDTLDCWHIALPRTSQEGFHFSRGLGPFQITLGDINSKGVYPDLGKVWSNWKTIDKLNSTYALNSTLYRHVYKNKETPITNLEDLRVKMLGDWNGYQFSSTGLGNWEDKWLATTGTTWDTVKNSNINTQFLNGYDTSWAEIKAELIENEKNNPWMPENEAIKDIGNQKWIIRESDGIENATGDMVIIDEFLPTWTISAWKTEGTELKYCYYYAYHEKYDVEIWALSSNPKFIFTRTYAKDNPKDSTFYQMGAHSPDNCGLELDSTPIEIGLKPDLYSNVDVALIIDSSGSMDWNDPRDLRKSAAKLFIDLVDDNDKIAVVDFDGSVRVWQSLIDAGPNHGTYRNSLKNAVDKVDSSGNTNIGGGLRYGYNELNSVAADPLHRQAAILLTDGQDGSGTNPLVVLPDYQVKGWPIYTIALSSDADVNLLKQIAADTGGKFYSAPDDEALQDIYSTISLNIKGSSQLDKQTGKISQGETLIGSLPVDTSVMAFNLVLVWPGSDLDLVLYYPDGTAVPLNSSSPSGTDDPAISYIAQSTYEIYKVQNPTPGTWRYDIIGVDILNQADYTLTLSAATNIMLIASVDKQDYYPGENVHITAEFSDNTGGISGAQVNAEVRLPDRSHETVILSDKSNGLYSGTFSNTLQRGYYSVLVQAEKEGIVRQNQVGFATDTGSVIRPIANFTANATDGVYPLSVQFTDTSNYAPTSWEWDFGDGTPPVQAQNPVHVYTTPGIYSVNLTASNVAGEDTLSRQEYIVVEPPFYANFMADPISGTSPLTVQFTDTSRGQPIFRRYEFGDGFMSANSSPSHTYLKPGTYSVKLTIWQIGNRKIVSTTTEKNYLITVVSAPIPPVEADFIASPVTGVAPLTVQFTDTSVGTPMTYHYEFGDGFRSVDSNPSHTYSKPGTYSVKLTIWQIQDQKLVRSNIEKTALITVV